MVEGKTSEAPFFKVQPRKITVCCTTVNLLLKEFSFNALNDLFKVTKATHHLFDQITPNVFSASFLLND